MQNQDYLNIVNEPLSIVEERKTLKNEIETLKSAQKIVKRDPEYAIPLSISQSLRIHPQARAGQRR